MISRLFSFVKSRARAVAAGAANKPVAERLEDRRLMSSYFPVITPTALVSDTSNINSTQFDQNLVNPWGLAVTPNGRYWTANNVTGFSTEYDGKGVAQPTPTNQLVVEVPVLPGGGGSAPTGVVYHGGAGFNLTVNGKVGPSSLLYATETGTIAGYNPSLDPTSAVIAVDHSGSQDVFKGLAIRGSGRAAKIYATDFFNNRVEVFDSNFKEVSLKAGAFTDPLLPAGFSAFGIQSIRGKIYVTYALQDAQHAQDVPGPSNGIIDVYSSSGKFMKRMATGQLLNSPWGMVQIPKGWGQLSGGTLVGNFGDGTISIYDKKDHLIGQIPSSAGGPLSIGGLWSLETGVKKDAKTIYFTAGPNSEGDGIFGTLVASKPPKVKK